MKRWPRTMCGDAARVHVSSVTTGSVWIVCCGPDGSPHPGAASTITTATAAATLMDRVTCAVSVPAASAPAPNVIIFHCPRGDQRGVSPMLQPLLVGLAAGEVLLLVCT